MAQAHPPDTSRRERRKLELRGRILEAGVALFDARGFAATKVTDICERADVAEKTFFNHFHSKRDMLREIAGEALGRLLADIEEVRKQPLPTRERLGRFFARVADNADAAGPMHRELLTEMIHVGHESGTEPAQARQLHDAFAALVSDGRAAGEIKRDASVETQTELVLGSFYALMFNWVHLEGYPLRRQALAAARVLGDALCGPAEDRPA